MSFTFLRCRLQQHAVSLATKEHYSLLTPYFENKALVAKQYTFMFEYTTPETSKIHDFLYSHCKGGYCWGFRLCECYTKQTKLFGTYPYPVVLPEKPKALTATDKVDLFRYQFW